MNQKSLVIERETLYNQIQKCRGLTEDDAPRLRELLQDAVVQALLHDYLVESDAKGSIMLGIDLTDAKGVAKGIKIQGAAFGLIRAVDILFDTAYPLEQETEIEDASR